MSEIIWHKHLIADSSSETQDLVDDIFKMTVPGTRKVSADTQSLQIPDPKAFRSMSRASVFLSHLCLDLGEVMKDELAVSPFSIAIYCAVENGPIDAPTTQKIIQAPAETFPDIYRKLRSPKMYLKQLPNLAPAQLGISLGIQGMMNVYTHSQMGSLQALEQAEEDLNNDRVTLALVCSAHAFDDFLVVARTKKNDPRILCEGVGALLLKKNTVKTKWKEKIVKDLTQGFGISDQIINIVTHL